MLIRFCDLMILQCVSVNFDLMMSDVGLGSGQVSSPFELFPVFVTDALITMRTLLMMP